MANVDVQPADFRHQNNNHNPKEQSHPPSENAPLFHVLGSIVYKRTATTQKNNRCDCSQIIKQDPKEQPYHRRKDVPLYNYDSAIEIRSPKPPGCLLGDEQAPGRPYSGTQKSTFTKGTSKEHPPGDHIPPSPRTQ